VEEITRGEAVSDICKFPVQNDDETAEWIRLAKDNVFPEPDASEEPTSYVKGDYWLSKLESLAKQSWYSQLHIGIIKYAGGDLEGAKQAWEASLAFKPSPWALRNLSMVYKNELGDDVTAKEYIKKAFDLKKDCLALCTELAAQLTAGDDDAEWLAVYEALSPALQANGRLRLYKAIALMNLGRLKEATEIINADFVMSDIKEGELSVSSLWFDLYGRLYAESEGIPFDPTDCEQKQKAAKRYPLPKKLDFRMHD